MDGERRHDRWPARQNDCVGTDAFVRPASEASVRTPSPWVIFWNHSVTGKLHFNLRAAMRWGQNLEAKAVASTQYSEIPTLSVAHNATLRMGHLNCRRRSARPTLREAQGKADSQQLDFQRSFV